MQTMLAENMSDEDRMEFEVQLWMPAEDAIEAAADMKKQNYDLLAELGDVMI